MTCFAGRPSPGTAVDCHAGARRRLPMNPETLNVPCIAAAACSALFSFVAFMVWWSGHWSMVMRLRVLAVLMLEQTPVGLASICLHLSTASRGLSPQSQPPQSQSQLPISTNSWRADSHQSLRDVSELLLLSQSAPRASVSPPQQISAGRVESKYNSNIHP